jgi:uncharacterized membrane protein
MMTMLLLLLLLLLLFFVVVFVVSISFLFAAQAHVALQAVLLRVLRLGGHLCYSSYYHLTNVRGSQNAGIIHGCPCEHASIAEQQQQQLQYLSFFPCFHSKLGCNFDKM